MHRPKLRKMGKSQNEPHTPKDRSGGDQRRAVLGSFQLIFYQAFQFRMSRVLFSIAYRRNKATGRWSLQGCHVLLTPLTRLTESVIQPVSQFDQMWRYLCHMIKLAPCGRVPQKMCRSCIQLWSIGVLGDIRGPHQLMDISILACSEDR